MSGVFAGSARRQVQGLLECTVRHRVGSHLPGEARIGTGTAQDSDGGLAGFVLLSADDKGACGLSNGIHENQRPLALAVNAWQRGDTKAVVAADILAALVHQGLSEDKQVPLGRPRCARIHGCLEAPSTIGKGDQSDG